MVESWWIYLISVLASFITVFLKGFQYMNVLGNHYKLTFVTSYLMAIADVVCITLIIKGGWLIALTSGTGASIGMITSMYLHDKFVKKNE